MPGREVGSLEFGLQVDVSHLIVGTCLKPGRILSSLLHFKNVLFVCAHVVRYSCMGSQRTA